MAMHVQLSPTVEDRLRARAERQGLTPETYASRLIEEAVSGRRLDKFVGSARARFEQSGRSDESLGDLLEREKHAARTL
jgi:hypothetical protein